MSERLFNFNDVILAITLGECLLLVLLHQILPLGRKVDTKILSAFLFSIALTCTATLIVWNESLALSPHNQWFPLLYVLAFLARGPLLYLYVVSITDRCFRFNRQTAVHTLPTLIGLCLAYMIELNFSDMRLRGIETSLDACWYYVKITSIAYAFAAIYQVIGYKNSLRNNYSSFSSSNSTWLLLLCISFTLHWLWVLFIYIHSALVGGALSETFGAIHNYIMFTLINTLFIYSVRGAKHLPNSNPASSQQRQTKASEPSSTQPIQARLNAADIAKVKKSMLEDKLYLQHNLNIAQLSLAIHLSGKTISRIINQEFNMNFFEFINTYRVEEAKKHLTDKKLAKQSILDILLLSGFNSKSAFHRSFQKRVNMSPSEYRIKAKVQGE
ncbi:MAG: helix-turn-helix domain-containing protein [Colwellia sp.]